MFLWHYSISITAEKAGYKREDMLKLEDNSNRHPLHGAVLGGDLKVRNVICRSEDELIYYMKMLQWSELLSLIGIFNLCDVRKIWKLR